MSFAPVFAPLSSLFDGLPILPARGFEEALEGWEEGRLSAGSLDRDTIVVSCGENRPTVAKWVCGERVSTRAGLHVRRTHGYNAVFIEQEKGWEEEGRVMLLVVV
jgi:hypothetical protein